MSEQEKKALEVIENLEPVKRLRTDSIKVSIIDDKNQEIWAHGFEHGIPIGISNTSLDFNKIVKIIEIALEQAKG